MTNVQQLWNAIYRCNACGKAVIAMVKMMTGSNPSHVIGDIATAHQMALINAIYPTISPIEAPEYCPTEVASAFIQAEHAIRNEHAESSASMDRRALEIGTKLIDPGLAGLKLNQRINELANKNLITPALRDWAHGLRIVGNDALHDMEGVTIEEAKQAHELTRFMLIYLFTLPEQVRLSKAENAPKSTE